MPHQRYKHKTCKVNPHMNSQLLWRHSDVNVYGVCCSIYDFSECIVFGMFYLFMFVSFVLFLNLIQLASLLRPLSQFPISLENPCNYLFWTETHCMKLLYLIVRFVLLVLALLFWVTRMGSTVIQKLDFRFGTFVIQPVCLHFKAVGCHMFWFV